MRYFQDYDPTRTLDPWVVRRLPDRAVVAAYAERIFADDALARIGTAPLPPLASVPPVVPKVNRQPLTETLLTRSATDFTTQTDRLMLSPQQGVNEQTRAAL